MTTFKERLRALGYGKETPFAARGNHGNSCRNNGLEVPKASVGWEPAGIHNPLKRLQFPKFPGFPPEVQGSQRLRHGRWWQETSEVRARFDEIAGWLEFDGGRRRHEAEHLARDCLVGELIAFGLTRDTAVAIVTRIGEDPYDV